MRVYVMEFMNVDYKLVYVLCRNEKDLIYVLSNYDKELYELFSIKVLDDFYLDYRDFLVTDLDKDLELGI